MFYATNFDPKIAPSKTKYNTQIHNMYRWTNIPSKNKRIYLCYMQNCKHERFILPVFIFWYTKKTLPQHYFGLRIFITWKDVYALRLLVERAYCSGAPHHIGCLNCITHIHIHPDSVYYIMGPTEYVPVPVQCLDYITPVVHIWKIYQTKRQPEQHQTNTVVKTMKRHVKSDLNYKS